jgi:hypothetical protein
LTAPLPTDAASAELLLRALREAAPQEPGEGPVHTLVLLLGRPEEVRRLPHALGCAVGGLRAPGLPTRLRVVAISPWVLDNVERVARVLREFEATARAESYPPMAQVHPDPGVLLPKWLGRSGRHVAIVTPASHPDRSSFRAACELRRAQLRDEQAAAQRTHRPFDPGPLHALDVLQSLLDKTDELAEIAVCPVCDAEHRPIDPRQTLTERGTTWTYSCTCAECDTEWGLWTCRSCREAFPVLILSGSQPALLQKSDTEPPMTADTDWLDRTFGRDVFAEPCRYAARTFRCTRCGSCPGEDCGRCTTP